MNKNKQFTDDYELQEWLEALDNVINENGPERASEILSELASKLTSSGTIPPSILQLHLETPSQLQMRQGCLVIYSWSGKYVLI